MSAEDAPKLCQELFLSSNDAPIHSQNKPFRVGSQKGDF